MSVQTVATVATKDLHASALDGRLCIDDLRSITVPASLPMACDLFYNATAVSKGQRIGVYVGEDLVGAIEYSGETGQKHARFDLSRYMVPGINQVFCRCVVGKGPLDCNGDEALFWIRRGDDTVIKKRYSTNAVFEPYSQQWLIDVSK